MRAAAAREQARDSLLTAYTAYRVAADAKLEASGRRGSHPLLTAVGSWLYLARQAGRAREVSSG